MKRLTLLLNFLFWGIFAYSQVNFFHGTLAEAVQKAKTENKYVMAIGSTTWCGPCKHLTNNILTTKACGDGMNDKYVVIKYFLDKHDPDSITVKYGVQAYPTLLFINGDGVEINRKLGAGKDAKSFLADIETYVHPDSTFQAREQRMKINPDERIKYANYLVQKCRKLQDGVAIINDIFTGKLSTKEFTPNYLQFYDKMMMAPESTVFNLFIKHRDKITDVIGESKYLSLMKAKCNSFVMDCFKNGSLSSKKLKAVDNVVLSNSFLATDFYQLVKREKENLRTDSFDSLYPLFMKGIEKANTSTRLSLFQLFFKLTVPEDRVVNKLKITEMYECAIKMEKNKDINLKYQRSLYNYQKSSL